MTEAMRDRVLADYPALGRWRTELPEARPGDAAWNALQDWLPAHVLDRSLHHVELPRRILGAARLLGMSSVRELVAVPRSLWLQQRKIGRRTLEDAEAALVALATTSPVSLRDHATFWDLLRSVLAGPLPRDEAIVAARSGLFAAPATYRSIGSALGLSRQRVWAIEQAGIARVRKSWPWVPAVVARLHALVPPDGGMDLAQLADADPWFDAAEQRAATLRWFVTSIARSPLAVERTLQGSWRLVVASDRP